MLVRKLFHGVIDAVLHTLVATVSKDLSRMCAHRATRRNRSLTVQCEYDIAFHIIHFHTILHVRLVDDDPQIKGGEHLFGAIF